MKQASSTFYVVRHGETHWNAARRIQGHSDIPLNEIGIQQATKAATALAHVPFDMAFSSDLLRAHRTAEIIAAEHALVVKTTEVLRERFYGTLEGKDVQELDLLHNQLSTLLSAERDAHRASFNVESDESVVRRLITFIRETAIAYPGKTVLIVCHGGLIRQLLHELGCYPRTLERRVRVGNTGFVAFETDGADFSVKEISGVTLLDA
ncbi:histidine phosphatase family protein [Candidatus Microgenomates bacterium]|nr:histidine phosphatase family protein [Candidatus Microgenomates bacterium]